MIRFLLVLITIGVCNPLSTWGQHHSNVADRSARPRLSSDVRTHKSSLGRITDRDFQRYDLVENSHREKTVRNLVKQNHQLQEELSVTTQLLKETTGKLAQAREVIMKLRHRNERLTRWILRWEQQMSQQSKRLEELRNRLQAAASGQF